MEKAILVKNLCKKYGDLTAVKNINFEVRSGEFFAFLGPNGAGKSTTINILCGLLNKISGDAIVCGNSVDKNRHLIHKNIGVVFQGNVLDDLLTVKENLLNRGALYFKSPKKLKQKYNFVVNFLAINSIENQTFKTLSGGQKRKVEIARALIGDPKILILDEPTTGLDPETRKDVWKLLEILKTKHNLTIFLTTHYMEEASEADYIIVIDKGEITAKGTPDELKTTYSVDALKLFAKNVKAVEKYLKNKKLNYTINKNQVKIELQNTKQSIQIVNDLKADIISLEVLKGSLDDAFVNIIRR